MKIQILAVGRLTTEFALLAGGYQRRLGSYAECSVVELAESRAKQPSQRKQEEGKELLKRASPGFTLLDERGSQPDSNEMASHLAKQRGNAELNFIIGGADGVDEPLRAEAGIVWSLSRLTLPHQFARLLLLEQLYRAFSINAGHPYHRV